MIEAGVRAERSGWRDQRISERHRHWGFDCPAVDLDFLVAEYNHGLPVALIEYKHHGGIAPTVAHPTYRALRALADGYHRLSEGQYVHDPLPFLWAYYWPEVWAIRAFPVNDVARAQFGVGEALSEFEFVRRLYRMRRLTLNRKLAGALNTQPPPLTSAPARG